MLSPPPLPAQLRVVASPWATVKIDDEPEFYTPRAEFLSVEPGRHRIVFTHPTFGTKEYEVELASGDAEVVRHTFDPAPRP